MTTEEDSVRLMPVWYTIPEVAALLGYGETKVRSLIIQGDLKSIKDGHCRRVLPKWVDEYVQRKCAEAEDNW